MLLLKIYFGTITDSISYDGFVNRQMEHDAVFPIEPFEVSRKAIVHGPNVHMEIGIAKRKNAVMMPGIKPNHID